VQEMKKHVHLFGKKWGKRSPEAAVCEQTEFKKRSEKKKKKGFN